MRFFAAITISVLLLTPAASAATYYVALTGSDSASGSIDAPFRTLKKAARTVTAGDIVNVRAGVYPEATSIYSKGTASSRIVFRAMAGEKVILDGSTLPSGTAIVTLNETEYVDFSGFEVRNSPFIGITLWHAKNTRVLNNHIHHTVRNGIYAGGDTLGVSADITVSGNDVHDTVLENQYHNMGSGGWAGAVVVSRTERSTITDNKIWNNDGEGLISVRSNHAVIRNNEIADSFSVSLYLDNARYATVAGNLIYSTGNTRYYRDGKPAAGIAIANEEANITNPSSDNVIANNIVVGTKWGFYYGNFQNGGGLKNTKVVNNTFYGTTDDIVRVDTDTHSNSEIANNIFYQTTSAAPRYAGGSGVTFRNNLWYGGSAGVAAGSNDRYGDPLFANAGGRRSNDYKIGALSPAVHAGIDLAVVTSDFFGGVRTPASDIGAHEMSVSLGSSAPVTPLPTAPSTVRANMNGSNVRVTWTTSSQNVARFHVYRNGAFIDTVATSEFVDSSVEPGMSYSYEIAAEDMLGNESPRSKAASVTTPAAVDRTSPSKPEKVRGNAVSNVAVQLSWDVSSDNVAVRSYTIYRDGQAVASVKNGTTHVDGGLAASTTYNYAVVAVDAAGNESPKSATVSVRTKNSGRSRAVR